MTQSLMLTSPLPPSFLDTHNLFMVFLGYKLLCMIINPPSLCAVFIYLNSTIVHFSLKIQSILHGGLFRYLFFWRDFCGKVWFQEVLFFLVCSFLTFSFICLLGGVRFQYSKIFVIFIFSKGSDALLVR